jgi:xanthine dehydrogenase accessory factor
MRGAGEMATGTACRLWRAGFSKLLMTEIESPLAVRRTVSFSEAVHDGISVVEGIKAIRISHPDEAAETWAQGLIPLLVDPENSARHVIKPDVIVDATLAKTNLGTTIDDAPLVIGLGPGFHAGRDVHYVVETNRGHDLGRLISEGPAAPDTGIPGNIGGHTVKRLLRAPAQGVLQSNLEIGSLVAEGQEIAFVAGMPVRGAISGVLRGLMRSDTLVETGMKIGDIDPRGDISYCYTISDKARAIGGAVLEAILMKYNRTV